MSEGGREGGREGGSVCLCACVCVSERGEGDRVRKTHLVKTAAPFSPKCSRAGCCNNRASRKFCELVSE